MEPIADFFGIVTRDIAALNQADSILNGKDSAEKSCLLFVAKAIMLLCATRKNRDADYVACNYLWGSQKLSGDELPAFTVHSETNGPAATKTKNGYTADNKVNGNKSAIHANLMFIAKAIILLSMARKNPNANYISCDSLR